MNTMSTATAKPVSRAKLASGQPRSGHRSAACRHVESSRLSLQRSGIQLTRRGRITVLLGLFAVMAFFVVAGAFRATAAPSDPPAGWVATVVQPGQTLWDLAQERGDGGDPRALIAQIKAVNGLVDSQLASGQALLLPH